VYTTFYLYLCVFYICWISYKHVKLNWHEMPTKKNNNLENIRRNLVSNPSCRGQNKTIMSTRLSGFNTLYCACSFTYSILNCVSAVQVNIKCYFTYGVRGCTCKMTSFLDSTHVYLPKNITGISVIDCDRYNLLAFNFQPRNSLAQ